MPNPLFSVLITVYNRESLVGGAIKSVLASSLGDWELIAVDDCSTDSSFDVLREFAKMDSRISVYRNETNLGDYPNRNHAARYAKGRYLKYVDSDDVIFPYSLKILSEMLTAFPDAGLALAGIPPDRIPPFQLSARDALIAHFTQFGLLGRAPGSAVVPRAAFEQVGGFPEVRHFGDSGLWLQLAARFPVVVLPPGWHWDRILPDSEKTRRTQFISPILGKLRYDLDFLRQDWIPLTELERKKFSKQLISKAKREALRRFLRTRNWSEWRILSETLRIV